MEIKIEKIIRTKRKTISLQITENATLIVKAPFNTDDKTIEKVIVNKKEWIEKNLKKINARNYKFKPKEFVNGEGFLYLGKYYKLTIVEEQDVPLKFDNRFYLSKNALSNAKEVFIHWYKKEAHKKISERVEYYAKKTGFKYNKINITNAQKRWASCSFNNNLNFSWRLIMAPLSIIDYVVVHELCHTVEKKHSKKFWDKIKVILPDYKKRDDWLKEYGHLLKI